MYYLFVNLTILSLQILFM